MFKELLSVFRSSDPLRAMGDNFSEMLTLTYQMTTAAGEMFFSGVSSPQGRSELYDHDVRVNRLERQIRKQVVAHLSLSGNRPDVPYSLLLMSLVKDVERIGDYAKNLGEANEIHAGALTKDENALELQEIRQNVEESFKALSDVFAKADKERAVQLILKGRDTARRCDALIARIAGADYDAGTATVLALVTRYYKRIGGHVLNVLSSIVMPIHKIDYYDEDEIRDTPG
jgi:phosphate transport system protein